jgi:hypothetical protein
MFKKQARKHKEKYRFMTVSHPYYIKKGFEWIFVLPVPLQRYQPLVVLEGLVSFSNIES